jgi:hypothetical protein
MDAYDLYVSCGGEKVIIPTNEHVQKIIAAITDGIAAGVAMHNAASTATLP